MDVLSNNAGLANTELALEMSHRRGRGSVVVDLNLTPGPPTAVNRRPRGGRPGSGDDCQRHQWPLLVPALPVASSHLSVLAWRHRPTRARCSSGLDYAIDRQR